MARRKGIETGLVVVMDPWHPRREGAGSKPGQSKEAVALHEALKSLCARLVMAEVSRRLRELLVSAYGRGTHSYLWPSAERYAAVESGKIAAPVVEAFVCEAAQGGGFLKECKRVLVSTRPVWVAGLANQYGDDDAVRVNNWSR